MTNKTKLAKLTKTSIQLAKAALLFCHSIQEQRKKVWVLNKYAPENSIIFTKAFGRYISQKYAKRQNEHS